MYEFIVGFVDKKPLLDGSWEWSSDNYFDMFGRALGES